MVFHYNDNRAVTRNCPSKDKVCRTGAAPGRCALGALVAGFLISIVLVSILPDGMQQCEQTHSFDTCHATLNR